MDWILMNKGIGVNKEDWKSSQYKVPGCHYGKKITFMTLRTKIATEAKCYDLSWIDAL